MGMREFKLWLRQQKRDPEQCYQRVPSHVKQWLNELGWRIGRTRHDYVAVKGDRQLRVLYHLNPVRLQICDGDFDRWANSVGAEVELAGWPTSKAGLRTLIRQLKADTRTFDERTRVAA